MNSMNSLRFLPSKDFLEALHDAHRKLDDLELRGED